MKTELFSIADISLAYKINKRTILRNSQRLNLTPYKKQSDKSFYFSRDQVVKIITYNPNGNPEVPYREVFESVEVWYVFPSKMNWDKSI
jgi:hypothetical protein